MNVLHIAGGLLFSLPLLYQGVTNLGQLQRLADEAAGKGMPNSTLLMGGAMVWLIVGTLMLIVGWQRPFAGVMVALFLVGTGSVIHNFWTVTDPASRHYEQISFLKNLSIAGGALLFTAL